MSCEFFGKCGGCALPLEYEEQLRQKLDDFRWLMKPLNIPEPEVFVSEPWHFRNRAEFIVLRDENGRLKLGMSPLGDRKKIAIGNCPITNRAFSGVIEKLLDFLGSDEELENRLFGINFLSNTDGLDLIVVLIYHRKLDESFMDKLDLIRSRFGINVIARSRGVKLVAGSDYVVERVLGKRYKQLEGSFTQPNGGVNQKMVGWVVENSPRSDWDLLELYCGNGNFSIALAERFRKVVAIEIAKSSLALARENAELNGVENISFVRMDAKEFTDAYRRTREFFRLKELDLDSLNINSVFVDPPRAGLDPDSLDLITNFENIIYISCNPETLFRDLEQLIKSHRVVKTAVFDQFVYTPHLETGVILKRAS